MPSSTRPQTASRTNYPPTVTRFAAFDSAGGRLTANLAAISGIHNGRDAVKMLMAGADVTMLCSALIRRGIPYITLVERELAEWLEQHEYDSVEQLKGSLSQMKSPS